MLVRQNLDLDMPCGLDIFLHVERAVAEGGLRLRGGGAHGSFQFIGVANEAHPAPAAARARLEQEGIADAVRIGARLPYTADAVGAGHPQHISPIGDPDRCQLVPHRLDRFGGRTDKGDPVFPAQAGEFGALRQEPITRMQCFAPGADGGGDEGVGVEIACRGACRPDTHRACRQPGSHALAVRVGHRRDGLDPECLARAYDTHRDFAAVGDKHALERRTGHAL